MTLDDTIAYLGFLDADVAAGVLRAGDAHVGDHVRRSLHGGVLAAFCEHVAAARLEEVTGRVAEAVTVTCDFLREAEVADTFAETEIVRSGRRFATVIVTARQADADRVVAICTATFALVDP